MEATRCAIEIQEFLHDYNASTNENWKIKLRIGIHLAKDILELQKPEGNRKNLRGAKTRWDG